jgi:zinc D-Ala-D-Ala carboxypeptidase
MKLTKNFTLEEFTHSQTAIRHSLNNDPSSKKIENIKRLCEVILQPLRDELNLPIVISSGYRSPKVNSLTQGSSPTSQHTKGEAADIIVPGLSVFEVIDIIDEILLPYDQLINEFNKWIHISFSLKQQRREKLIAYMTKKGKVLEYVK